MIYTVNYFNPIANCENVVHVKADSELEACLIAHAQMWTSQKEFDFNDYDACEYNESYIITKEDIKHWTNDELNIAKEKAINDFIKDEYKYCKNYYDDFINACKYKLGLNEDEIKNKLIELNLEK